MKKNKIIFWVTATLIFLFEGVMPALFSQKKESIDAMNHLGYPAYFGITLAVFKVLGALALIIPMVPKRVKEWAYAGFAFDFIFAFISNTVTYGFGAYSISAIVALLILIISYISYHKSYGASIN
jgi:hypothetical protein